MMRHFYIFLSLFSLSSFLSSVSCAGPSLTLVDPNNPAIPRISDFRSCKIDTTLCQDYKCSTGTCWQQSCSDCNHDRAITFTCKAGYTNIVPFCSDTQVAFTAAIINSIQPAEAMKKTALGCGVENQMVYLSSTDSSKNLGDIINAKLPDAAPSLYKVYDVNLGFFQQTDQDQEPYTVLDTFMTRLKDDTQYSLLDNPGIWSIDRAAGALVNISQIQITPATFAITRCQDGTSVAGDDTCPPIDPALVPMNTATSSTIALLTIILPIIGGVVAIALIIAAIIIVRRRRANKVMRQTIQHTDPTVEVTMA